MTEHRSPLETGLSEWRSAAVPAARIAVNRKRHLKVRRLAAKLRGN